MAPRYMFGVIVGIVGLVINSCVAFAVGFCGPFTGLLFGAVAGFLAATREKLPEKGDNARAGATAGGIAGLFLMGGQVIGGLTALVFYQISGTPLPFGNLDMSNMGTPELVGAYVGGLGTGICFGLIGALFSAVAGAAAAFFAPTGDQAALSGD